MAIERKVGQRVTCNGYPGTITRVCEWTNGMVEVRLERGIVCVDFAELLPPATLRDRAAAALDRTHHLDNRGPKTAAARVFLARWLDGVDGRINVARIVRSVEWLEHVALLEEVPHG